MIRTNQNIGVVDISEYSFLYSVYRGDTAFFLNNVMSVMEPFDTIYCFLN